MASIKDRKIYSFSNFRGLDKENKKIKVAPFRATDGKNFIIDSETLKTRPAIKRFKELGFQLEENEYIIDWYYFRDVILYVTNKHFRIEYGTVYLTEKSTTNVISNLGELNFEGLEPIFQEEKDSLFIFGLNGIYVISMIYNESNVRTNFVIYELSNKPTNDVALDLPTPYEPTLFIGNNRLDDVNLLSKVSKYDIFVSNQKTDDDMIKYNLPTHYDVDKHKAYDYEVTLYKDRYKDIKVFPLFKGFDGDNFVKGTKVAINEDNPIKIDNTFSSLIDFEYFRDGTEIEKIKENLGLTKDVFFNFNVEGRNLYQYLMDLIRLQYNEIEDNELLAFELDISVNCIYKEKTNGLILQRVLENKKIKIYVELKKTITLSYDLTDITLTVSQKSENGTFPDYPIDEPEYIEIRKESDPDKAFELSSLNETEQKAMFETYISNNIDSYNNNEIAKLKAKFYEIKKVIVENNSVNGYQYSNDYFVSEIKRWGGANAEPEYELFPPYVYTDSKLRSIFPDSYIMEERSNVRLRPGSDDIRYDDDFYRQIKNILENNYSNFPNYSGDGILKVHGTWYNDDGNGYFYDMLVSIIIFFTYEKSYETEYKIKQSVNYSATVRKENSSIITEDNNRLYEFSYNEKDKVFNFKLRDFFYDYNNEPTVSIKVTFRFNPDYDYIAKSKIGTTFGSENRLFLAGNSEFPNIDRYNVSNDLLGNNVKNQSYELSYFPSKNYRVLGGKGAINGYVVATDTQLYVTKKEYPNDQTLFIRERILDENGIVGYKEYKTNINKTPLNSKCIVRFYNDILMLTKDGLFGVEISSNVLTNERLLKLRSGFINTELINAVKNAEKVFIAENNEYMYIFIDNVIYVADIRYTASNPNSMVENVSYEIVKWEIPLSFKNFKFNKDLILLDKKGERYYTLKNDNKDDLFTKHTGISIYDKNTNGTILVGNDNMFMLPQSIENLIYKSGEFHFDYIYKEIAIKDKDFTLEGDIIKVSEDSIAFRNVKEGDVLYDKDKVSFTVIDFSDRENLIIDKNGLNLDVIYKDYSRIPLYVYQVFEFNDGMILFRLSPFIKEFNVYKQDTMTLSEFSEFINENLYDNDNYIINSNRFLFNESKNIELIWFSNINDFGNNFMEKTTFSMNVYATKQDKTNYFSIGYKTMRRLKAIDDTRFIELSNPFDFNEVDFNLSSISTMNEMGTSIPMKENNFLYIQFMVVGEGNIELNAIEILYKLNRMLKTVS